MHPTAAFEIARLSIANAREFEEQASLCIEHQWFGRAAALAILGQEELGKGSYFS